MNGVVRQAPGEATPGPPFLLVGAAIFVVGLVAALAFVVTGRPDRPEPPQVPPPTVKSADNSRSPPSQAPIVASAAASSPRRVEARSAPVTGRVVEGKASAVGRPPFSGRAPNFPGLKTAQASAHVELSLQSSTSRGTGLALWNYWLEAKAGTDAIPHPEAGPLQLESKHRLRFRLSMLDLGTMFDGVGSTAVSKSAMAVLTKAAVDTSRDEYPVDVVVHSVDDDRLEIIDGTELSTAKIDLAALRKALADPKGVPTPGSAAILDVLRRTLVAQFGFDFIAHAAGTHQASVMLVDKTTGYPLESLIIDITTGQSWPKSVSVDQSASSLLKAPSAPIDLALFLYDLRTTDKSLRDARLMANLWFNDEATQQRRMISWRTELTWDGIKSETTSIRNVQASKTSGATLLQQGRAYGRDVFNPLPDSSTPAKEVASANNMAKALAARKVLLARANYPDGGLPPTMIVRIISSQGQAEYSSLVLPVSALGVWEDDEDKAIYLGERFALSLLLANQEISANGSCPAAWHFALPDLKGTYTDRALKDAVKALQGMDTSWPDPNELFQDSMELKGLRKWITTGEADKSTYVFAYLGHHDTGRLYLSNDGGIAPGDIRRQFNGSSIAILNACTIALDDINSGTPVGKLARRGVGATIATTSSISGNLAADHVRCMRAVLNGRSKVTVGQAQALTVQCLWSSERSMPLVDAPLDYTGEALKYLLIGNPLQPMCAPKKREKT